MSDKEAPSLGNLIQGIVDAKLVDANFSMPGIVESYDRISQTAKIQPCFKRKYVDGKEVNLPIINGVPIVFPSSGGQWIHFDLAKGDEVTLVFSQRSLDNWKEKGGVLLPGDTRRFNLSDAFAYPGGKPKPKKLKLNGPEKSIEISNGKNFLTIEKDGKVKGKNDGGFFQMDKAGKFQFSNNTNELMDLLVQLTDILSKTTTNTVFGPMKLNDFAMLEQIKTKLETLKG